MTDLETARRARRWVKRYLYPPSGLPVRRVLAWMLLAVGVPRLPEINHVIPFGPLRVGTPDVFGLLLTALGLLMLLTCYHRRLHWFGRVVAGLSFVAWVTLAALTLSATSFLVDLSMALVSLAEVLTLDGEER